MRLGCGHTAYHVFLKIKFRETGKEGKMAISKMYDNGNCVGMVGDDIPARCFCTRCGSLLGSSEYEPEVKSMCARCAGGKQEETFAQICAKMNALLGNREEGKHGTTE